MSKHAICCVLTGILLIGKLYAADDFATTNNRSGPPNTTVPIGTLFVARAEYSALIGCLQGNNGSLQQCGVSIVVQRPGPTIMVASDGYSTLMSCLDGNNGNLDLCGVSVVMQDLPGQDADGR
jgi:hypothetical protein